METKSTSSVAFAEVTLDAAKTKVYAAAGRGAIYGRVVMTQAIGKTTRSSIGVTQLTNSRIATLRSPSP